MKFLLASYALILSLGVISLISGNHYFANIGGFLSAIGFMLVFFKDRPDDESEQQIKMRRYWYIVFATGILFSLIFGSFWNTHMGNMEAR
ncbi:hypothetical protein THMIRHAS_09440 [Thiosulfatimonas sediminis]|uniref:Uncharacterized protein n=1 Tax=Thiosulfatimonas sediminis TaxID=2675054 RepID=A0A6F8PTW4_9GAMM|nr:hypothetical protein [Thiosulfatimonas sediminis]BBP45571.1 hypothetical protein THMIRHAS_09440 [Thiosulfatimonas sediminis]